MSSFIPKESNIIVNASLTKKGRIKLSEGNFKITKFSIGDSEIDYEFNREFNYISENNIILNANKDYVEIKNKLKKNNIDETFDYTLNNLISNKIEVLNNIEKGFFTTDVNNNFVLKRTATYIKQPHIKINISQLSSNNNKTLLIVQSDDYGTIITEPEVGDYLLVCWTSPTDNIFSDGIVTQNSIYIFYKILSISGSLSGNALTVGIDKDLPNYGTISSNFNHGVILPKYNSILNYYGSEFLSDYWNFTNNNIISNSYLNGETLPVLNLNVIYKERIAGLLASLDLNKYNYTYYQILNYFNYININSIGIIHYSNSIPDNGVGEFYGDINIEIPTVLWHKKSNNTIGITIKSDNIIKVTNDNINLKYKDLFDIDNNYVGKVFHELKLIVIEDQELINVLSYKSNRNWTLPESFAIFSDTICDPIVRPTIEITNITPNEAIIGTTIRINVEITSINPIISVEYYANGILIGTVINGDLFFDWLVTNINNYVISVIAYDSNNYPSNVDYENLITVNVTPTPTVTPTGTPTNTPTSTPTRTPTGTPFATPTATNTPTPSFTPTPSITPTKTGTPTPTPTRTPSSTPEATPTPTPTLTPSGTPLETPTPTPTPTLTPTNSGTPLPTPTQTPAPSITPTNTPTPTITPTPSVTIGLTPTMTPSPSVTPSITPTQTPTQTPTNTPTPSITPTISVTPTNTPTPSITPTNTVTPGLTPTPTPSTLPITCELTANMLEINYIENDTNVPTWYHGVYEVLGGNVTIPLASDINLSNGIDINNQNPNNDITIEFNSGVNDFIWFAIPVMATSKTKWFVNTFNKGDIGGIKNINGNLFPDPEIITYNGTNYRIYISNYRTNVALITIKNN
jgi:hypothetical protein